MKKIITFFLIITFMLSIFPFANAEENVFVCNVLSENNTVSVSGIANESYVNVFLLNPGKNLSDLNASDSIESLKATVSHMNVISADEDGSYSYTFNINNPVDDEDYLLYVKSGESFYSETISAVNHISVYVSQNAASGGDGSENNPFSTIEDARDYVRTLNKTMPVDIIIKGGIYTVTSQINIGQADSGTEDAPITYKAADGEQVILTGAKELDISKFKKVTDNDILNRVYPHTAEKLLEIDLNEQGIPAELVDFTANLESGYLSKPMGVYLNDSQQTIARWPNSGYKTISNVIEFNGTATVIVNDAASRNSYAKAGDMYVEGYLGENWCGEWVKVAGISYNNILKLSNTGRYGIKKGQRVSVINLLEEIDTPGEWFVDKNTMKMYYYPPYELSDNDKFEIAVLTGNLMQLTDSNYINIEGLHFEKTVNNPAVNAVSKAMGSGLVVLRSDNVNIKNCKFTNIGMDAVELLDSQNVNVDGCYFYNMGYNGINIKMAGDIYNLTSGNVNISNCYIAKAARDSGKTDSACLYLDQCVGVTAENNVMRDTKNSAILYVHSCLNTFKNNEIYNCVNETSDAGAIYAGRTFVNFGNSIENNYFHNIGDEIDNMLAAAIFFDDGHSGNNVTGNIIDMNNKEYSAGVKIHGGRDNVVSNNVIANTDKQVIQQQLSSLNPIEDSFFSSELFTNFKYATYAANNSEYSLDIKNIGDEDWLPAYKEKFSEIMEIYSGLIKKEYTMKNTVENNANTYADLNLTDIGIINGFRVNEKDKEFDLIYPLNGESMSNNEIVLKWNLSPFADKYVYEVASDAKFEALFTSGETKSTENTVDLSSAGFEKDKTYYWRVKAINISNQFEEEVMCNDVFCFNTNGNIRIGSVADDGTNLICTVLNSKSEKEDVCVIAAKKDCEQRLISVDIDTISVEKDGENDAKLVISNDESSYVELYLWKSAENLIPISPKRTID